MAAKKQEPAEKPARSSVRSDARDNREKLLAAARRLFDRGGIGVGIDDIAREAGLGVGTVYRHFATKEALFAATVESHIAELIGEARTASEDPDVDSAFRRFCVRFLELGRRKKNLVEALARQGVDTAAVYAQMAEGFHAATAAMLERAQQAGAVRAGIQVEELIALLRGAFMALGPEADEASRGRVLSVVLDGLRPPPG
jgi:AcrR family transcriptional regulator